MIAALVLVGKYASYMAPWQVGLSSLVAVVPVFLAGLYFAKIRKTHKLTIYNHQGLLFRLLSGVTFTTIICTVIAIIDGALIYGQITTQQYDVNIKSLLLFLGIFYLCKILLDKILGDTYKAYYKPFVVLTKASILAAFIASLVWAYLDPLALNDLQAFRSVSEAASYVTEGRPQAYANCLALFQELVDLKESFALYFISRYANVYVCYLVSFCSEFLFFIGLSPFIGFAFINFPDIERIWSPPSEARLPASPKAAFWSTFFGIIGVGSYMVLLAMSEPMFQQLKPMVDNAVEIMTTTADKVLAEEDAQGNTLKLGTVEEYNKLVIKSVSGQIGKFVEEEIRVVNLMYDAFENNVDKYLDWYYSLSADYARLLKLLSGLDNFEKYMQEKLQEYLSSPQVERYMNQLERLRLNLSRDPYLPSYAEFIRDKIVTAKPWQLLETIPAPPLITFPDLVKKIEIVDKHFSMRMDVATTGGALAGALSVKLLAKKIAGKAAAKGAFKAAASAVTAFAGKTGVKAVASIAGGAGTGAAAGSVVPGVGTGIGALIGLVVGAITWVATDKIALELEEMVGRDEYRKELLATINEERSEQIKRLQDYLRESKRSIEEKEAR